jgi:hypothetical protein
MVGICMIFFDILTPYLMRKKIFIFLILQNLLEK